MAISVLGPLETGDTRPLILRERVVLAALIVYAGRTIAPRELADACWGERPPRTWPRQMRSAVAGIRAALGSGSVLTRDSEYALGLDTSTIDAFEFEDLVSAARRHALHDERDRAIDAYRCALALWRSQPYPELAQWVPAAIESGRLAELRDSAERELLEALYGGLEPTEDEAGHVFLPGSAERNDDDASVREISPERTVVADATAHRWRGARRLPWALAGTAVLLVAALVSGGLAIVRGGDASAAAEDRLIERIASRSLDLTDTDRAVAALLAVAAWQRWPDDVRTRSALLGTMAAAAGYIGTSYLPGATRWLAAAPIPGTRGVAVVRDDDTLEVRDVDTGVLLRTIAIVLPATSQETKPWIRVSADGSTILIVQHIDEVPVDADPDPAVDRDESLSFFDVASGERIGEPVHVAEWADTVELSAEGRFATWASAGPTIIADRDSAVVTRVETTTPTDTDRVTSSIAASAFRPDGRIVTTDIDDRSFISDPTTGALESTGRVPGGSGGVQLTVAADGTVVTGGASVIAALAPDGAPLWRVVPAIGDECSRAAASAVERILVCGSREGTGRITIRSLDTGELVSEPFDYQRGDPGRPVLTPDESEVWFMSALSSSIGRMRIDGSGPASLSVGGPEAYALGGTDPSGDYLVTGSRAARDADPADQRPLAVWDTRTDTVVADLTTFSDPDPFRTRAFVVAAQWIGPGELFLVFYDPRIAAVDYALYDVPHEIVTKAVFDDPIEWFFPARGGRLYALVPLGRGSESQRYRLVPYDRVSLQPVGERIEVDGLPVTVSVTADGTRIAVTSWSQAQRTWYTRIYAPDGAVVAERPGGATRTVIAGDRVLASDVSGLLALTIDLEPAESLTSRAASYLDLSTDDDGRTLLTTGGGPNGLRIFDLVSGRMLGHPIDVYASSTPTVIDADGTGFVASGDRGVQLWTLDPAAHADAACRIAGREFTREEWESVLAGFGPWHPLCTDVLATPFGSALSG